MLLTSVLLGALTPGLQDSPVRGPQPVLPHFEDVKTEAAPSPPVSAHPADAARLNQDPGQSLALQPAVEQGLPVWESHTHADRFQEVHVDRPSGGDWWVRGRTYKASFGPAGMTYIPFFGSEAPQNFPVEFKLVGAQAGGEELVLNGDTEAKHSAGAMSLDRGGLVERYLLEPESVEQTFVFSEATSGPLEVTVEVSTELTPRWTEDGMRFENELGAVLVSGAFAFDAEGRRTALDAEYQGNSYRVVVPADFVAEASFPLTIDPVVSTFAVDSISVSLTSPKAAFDPGTNSYLVVYNEAFSSMDGDVYSAVITSAGVVSLAGYVDLSAERWFGPGVGCARADDAFLVAAAVDSGFGTDGSIQGRLFKPSTGTYSLVFQVDSGIHTGPKRSVTVGGDVFDRFLVVWARSFSFTDDDVFARVVSSSGVPQGTSDIQLDNTTADYTQPSVSNINGDLNPGVARWAVVAQRDDGSSEHIYAAEVSWTGVVVEPFYLVYAASGNSLFPRVSAPLEQVGPKTFMVTWQRDFSSDFDVYAAIIRDGAPQVITDMSFNGLAGSSAFDDEFLPRVDTSGERFCLAWRDGVIGDAETTYASTLIYVAGQLCVAENAVLDATGSWDPSGLCANGSPGVGPDYLVAAEYETSGGADYIVAGFYDEEVACLGTPYCPPVVNSTGFGGEIYGLGSGVAGDPLVLYATRLPQNQFGFFLVSRNQGLTVGPGGSQGNLCLSGNIGRFNSVILNSGLLGNFSTVVDTNALPFDPVAPVLSGETLFFSTWYRDLNPNPTSNFTGGLRHTFD